jgi:hypothetical protein
MAEKDNIERFYDGDSEDFFPDEKDEEILYCTCGWEGKAKEAREFVMDNNKKEAWHEYICPKCRMTEWG